jgi:hypothetical protein
MNVDTDINNKYYIIFYDIIYKNSYKINYLKI